MRVPSRRSSELSARLQQVAFKTRTFRTPAYFRFSLSTTPAPFLLQSSLSPLFLSLARSLFLETKIVSQIFRTDVPRYSRNCSLIPSIRFEPHSRSDRSFKREGRDQIYDNCAKFEARTFLSEIAENFLVPRVGPNEPKYPRPCYFSSTLRSSYEIPLKITRPLNGPVSVPNYRRRCYRTRDRMTRRYSEIAETSKSRPQVFNARDDF